MKIVRNACKSMERLPHNSMAPPLIYSLTLALASICGVHPAKCSPCVRAAAAVATATNVYHIIVILAARIL